MARRNQSRPAQPVDENPAADPATETTQAGPSPDAVAEEEPPAQPVDDADTVPALVLLDCIYGKCGEVKRFDATQAPAIAAAGYIDTHVKAVAWGEGR